MNYYNLDLLRNAIVEQAAKDYLSLKKNYLKRKAKNIEARKPWELKSVEQWFLSSKFDEMCLNVEGRQMIRALDELAEKKAILHRGRTQPKR